MEADYFTGDKDQASSQRGGGSLTDTIVDGLMQKVSSPEFKKKVFKELIDPIIEQVIDSSREKAASYRNIVLTLYFIILLLLIVIIILLFYFHRQKK